jgi:hypothetical protein
VPWAAACRRSSLKTENEKGVRWPCRTKMEGQMEGGWWCCTMRRSGDEDGVGLVTNRLLVVGDDRVEVGVDRPRPPHHSQVEAQALMVVAHLGQRRRHLPQLHRLPPRRCHPLRPLPPPGTHRSIAIGVNRSGLGKG